LISLLKNLGDKPSKTHAKLKKKVKVVENEVEEKGNNGSVVESKFNKTALRPIKIPEDPIENSQQNEKNKISILNEQLGKRYDSVDSVNKAKYSDHKQMARQSPNKAIDIRDEEEGGIIMSNRQYNDDSSPSPSPERYDIEPSHAKKAFEIVPKPTKKTNYYSATNKKAKRYNYLNFEMTNSMRQKLKNDSKGNIASIYDPDSSIYMRSNTKDDSTSKVPKFLMFSSLLRGDERTI
jgi:hypothetical protein